MTGSEGGAWGSEDMEGSPSSHLWCRRTHSSLLGPGAVHTRRGLSLESPDSSPTATTLPGIAHLPRVRVGRTWAELLEGEPRAGLGVGTPSALWKGSL